MTKKKLKTLVGVVLDTSHSMETVKGATIEGFNSFISEQRRLKHKQIYVVTQFNGTYQIRQENVPLKDVVLLNIENYIPNGWTALHDAMGKTIQSMEVIMAKDPTIDRAIMLTLTDGQENASRMFTKDEVARLIETKQKTDKWAFNYVGANHDAIAVGTSFGIPKANTMWYSHDAVGTYNVLRCATVAVSNYSAGLSNALDDTVK